MRWLMMGYREDDERVQALEQAGHTVDTVPEADGGTWQSAARTAYDGGIWIRWAEADHSIRGVVGYRAQRPSTRIIIEIPDDIFPPNPEIGAWVNIGIYDIVRASADTLGVVANPRTIADALAWSGLRLPTPDDSPEKKAKPEVRTIEVTKKVAVSTRPVLIVVIGTSPGAGTTTTAVQIASYLAKGHDVALAETLKAPPALDRWADELPKGIATFSHPAPDPMDLLRRREWPYVVVDAGAIASWDEIAPWEADLTILVGPGDEHRFGRWEPLVRSVARAYSQRIVAGAIIGGPDSKRIAEGLDDEAGLSAFSLDGPQKRVDRAMADMLAPILPDGKSRRRWWRDPLHTPEPPAPARELGMTHHQEGSSMPDAFLRPRDVDVRVRGDEPSPLGKAFRWIMDALILWGFISLAAWVVVIANNAGAAGPVGQIWVQRAYSITSFNSMVLQHLHL